MQVVLVMFRGESDRRSFSLAKEVTVIGRREDCDLRIPLGEVSRKHCRLVKDAQELRVEDLGSSNGTYLNGNRVQESAVAPSDVLRIGSVSFVVQIDGVPAEEDMVPPSARPVQQTEPAEGAAEAATALQSTTQGEPASTEEFDPLAALNESSSQSAIDLIADEVADDLDNSGANQPAPTASENSAGVNLQEIKPEEQR